MSNLMFGRLPRREDPQGRTLLMSNYVKAVADPPLEVDNLNRVYTKLGINDPTVLFPMLGNNNAGDCTIAGFGHFKSLILGLSGTKYIPTDQEILDFYFAMTGGQDTGCNELDVLKKCHKKGCLGDKLPYYVALNPKDLREVRQTIWLFGACYIGFNVQQNAIDDFNNHVPWTPGVLTGDGHCVITPDYTQDMFTNLTWGDKQDGTVPWWNQTVDEAWLLVFPEEQQPEYLKDLGFDWDTLMADAQAIATTNKKKCWFF
jgi:hypothetical protein